MKARLHLHGHTAPGARGYIVGDAAALRDLARRLNNAANTVVGFETAEYYGSDGHAYELLIACDVHEDEWQTMPLPPQADPAQLSIVRTYDEMVNNSASV